MHGLIFFRSFVQRRLHHITPVLRLGRWKGYGHMRKFTDAMHAEKLAKVTMQKRPPIVSVMGHVNHGKTSLLDYLRSTQVAEKEAGGITQHIGAFSVLLNEQPVTFLDTPGHEAFSVLRSRGAKLTDLIVLVIAVDDGVQPQTVEVIQLSHEMKVPLIVAVNKIDRGVGALDTVLHELLHHNVQVEQLGGETQAIAVSAITGEKIDNLLESILAQAELLDLKADYSSPVEAVVVESKMTRGLGPTASVIIQQGTLKVGDYLYGSSSWARVRAMRNESGKPVKMATPATPVFTMGWKELPEPGEVVVQEKKSNIYSSMVLEEAGSPTKDQTRPSTKANDSSMITVPLVVKGDTIGSVESLVSVLNSLDHSMASLSITLTGVGDVTEGDLKIAQSINGIVLGFGTSRTKAINGLVEKYKVTLITDDVIYHLLEQLKDHVEKLLPRVEEEEVVGEAEVLDLFKLTGARKAYVAGCKIHHGYHMKDKLFRIIRDGKVIYQGDVSSMKHHQNDVFKISHGTECGLGFDKRVDIQPGDTVQCIVKTDVTQSLNWKF